MNIIKRNRAVMHDQILKLKPKKILLAELGIGGKSFGQNQGPKKKDSGRVAEHIQKEAKKKGKQEGYDQGYKEGFAQGKKEFEGQVHMLQKICQALETYKQQMIECLEPEIVRLGKYIAEKIIRQKIYDKEPIITNCLNFVLKQVTHLDKIIVYLNPDDHAYIHDSKHELEDVLHNFKDIKFVADRRIEKGGCVVETENGNIDAQPSRQMKIVDRLLEEELHKKSEEKHG